MGTRCVIGRLNPDGTVSAVYCAKDGYPNGAGRTLRENYTSDEAISALMALGPLNSLGRSPLEPLDYQDGLPLSMQEEITDAFLILEERCVRLPDRPDLHDPFQATSPEDFRRAVRRNRLDHAYLHQDGAWRHIHGPRPPTSET